jgi:uncharacterized protein (TIRG00374 family)
MSKNNKLAIKIFVTILLLLFVFSGSSIDAVFVFFQKYSGPVLVIVMMLQILANVIASIRWRLLLPEIPFFEILRFTFVGQFYSFVLPGQISGDVIKGYRMSVEKKYDGNKIAASIFADKILGFLGLIAVTIFGLIVTTSEQTNLLVLSTLFALFLIVLILGIKNFEKFPLFHLLEKRPSLHRLTQILGNFYFQFRQYTVDIRILGLSFILGIVFQFVAIVITYLLAQELGIGTKLFDWFWIFGAVSLAVAFPTTIAGLGVREGLFVFFLVRFGENHDAALALSLSIFGLQLIIALIGAVLELVGWTKSSASKEKGAAVL